MEEATHIVVSRQLLSEFSKGVKGLADEVSLVVCESSVAEISKRLVSFEEPVSVIREHWASLLEKQDEYEAAARVLEGIVLDSPHRQVKVREARWFPLFWMAYWLRARFFTRSTFWSALRRCGCWRRTITVQKRKFTRRQP